MLRASLLIVLACGYLLIDANASPQALQVTLQQLIQNPDAFNGKMISTVGYYSAEHHGPYLCADAKTAAEGAAGAWRIHLDMSNTSLPLEALRRVRHGYVKIIGTFQYRNMKITTRSDGARMIPSGFGWMNSLDKQITKITTFENVLIPKR